jgi:tetratricopeptide (TPR) repeat protein
MKSAAAINVLAAALLIAAVFLTFGGTLSGQFVWDDHLKVQGIAGRPADALHAEFWQKTHIESRASGLFRPLSVLTLLVDRRLWGEGPAGYHRTNVALHAAACVLLFLLLRLLLDDPLAALFGALFWGVHPLRAESVAFISGRTDVLAGCFALAGYVVLLTAVRRQRSPAGAAAFGALLFAIELAALLSKESALFALFAAPALVWAVRAPERPFDKRAFAGGLGGAALAVAPYAFLRVRAVGALPARIDARFLLHGFPIAAWKYLGLHFHFAGLAPYYTQPQSLWLTVAAWAGWLGVGALVVVLAYRGQRRPLLAALLYGVCLAPASGLAPLAMVVADRYTYLSGVAVALALALLLRRAFRLPRGLHTAAIAAAIGVVAVVGVAGRRQAAIWHDDVSLWTAAARRNPDHYLPAMNLGAALLEAGRADDARRACEQADFLTDHEYPKALMGLGAAAWASGRIDEAENAFAAAAAKGEYLDAALPALAKIALFKRDEAAAAAYLHRAEAAGACGAECRGLLARLQAGAPEAGDGKK